jgi:predicted phosphodiesterase
MSAMQSAAIAILALLTALPASARAEPYAWVQLGDTDKISARAIIEDGRCPTFSADGTTLTTTVRSDKTKTMAKVTGVTDLNTVTVCEADVPPNATALAMTQEQAGQAPVRSDLPLPPREIHRIVMFGDTGCRIKTSGQASELQDCNNKDAWPYAKVVSHAAAAKPDLVIHLGDYHYRESECPRERDCGTSWGYGLEPWKNDFFKPSQPLFKTAPWIMVRGNHEDCARAGEGWFRFLDHAPLPTECRDLTGFYVVKRANLGFVVMDNANAEEPSGNDATAAKNHLIALLQDQFRTIAHDIPPEAWLLSHRPVNALHYGGKAGYVSDNEIEQRAIGPELPAAIRMIASGHIHIFEALNFAGRRPPQLVVGTGGDNLEDIPPQRSTGVDINHAKVKQGLVFTRFGYMVWDKTGGGWTGTFFDDDGRPLTDCTLMLRTLTCAPKKV